MGLLQDLSDREVLAALVGRSLSISQIAEEVGCSKRTVRYWLTKHNLKTFRGPRGALPPDYQTPCRCACGETDPEKFYGHKTSVCARCHNDYTLLKGQEKRAKAIELLGGACGVCGFNGPSCALDIHHLDPTKKDPAFKSMRNWSWERILREIDGCALLCKNCHAIEHWEQGRTATLIE